MGHVILIDNGSDNVELWEGDLKGLKNLKIVRNKKNIGLPINYNRAAKYAYKHCYEWLIIFDQDTLIQEILGINYGIMSQSLTLL